MRNSPYWWTLIGFMLLLDIYVFQVIKSMAHNASGKTRTIIFSSYWVISIAALILLLLLPYLQFDKQARFAKGTVFALIAGLFFAKVVAGLFFLVDDLRRGVQWSFTRLSAPKTTVEQLPSGEKITRSAFLNWAGMLAGGGLFGTLVHGFSNKYRYQVRRVPLHFANLPAAFRGIKIAHISDIHCGSFNDKAAVIKGVNRILGEKPDLILFTGDLVNNSADEMDQYMDVFDKLEAPLGVYSVLGNHDYGDYITWDNDNQKTENLARLKQVHAELGWKLLLNEHVVLEKGGDQIALLGIENWSAKPAFPKYGKLEQAYAGTDSYPFRILMSHDPSHWRAEVCESYTGIDLALAGHTHGMQFGVEIPGFRWSPVQYMYKEWAGLYEKIAEGSGTASQRLYVNRGFGFIGYPGRVGILPEITVLELS